MICHLSHATKSFDADIDLPSSKSISNRALIIQALCEDSFEIINLSTANDTLVLNKALQQTSTTIDVQDCGTAYRFLTAFLASKSGEFILKGNPQMNKRPIKNLVDALIDLGADIQYLDNIGYPPLKINGKPLKGGTVSISANVSSQFISALLLIAPKLKNGLVLHLKEKVLSQPYIRMTLHIMSYYGIVYEWENDTIKILNQSYRAKNLVVEADWSSLAFFLQAMVFSSEATLRVKGLFKNSWQGDAQALTIFESFGIKSEFNSNGLQLKKHSSISFPAPCDINLIDYPDLAPPYCCMLAGIQQTATVTGLDNLMLKESHRLKALQTELKKMCQESSYNLESFKLSASSLCNPSVPFNAHNDHRIAMSLAPFGLLYDVAIVGAESVQKSFPNFWKEFQKIGFTITYSTH